MRQIYLKTSRLQRDGGGGMRGSRGNLERWLSVRRPATNQVLNKDVGRLSREVMCLETFYFIPGRLIRLRQERVMGTYSGKNP